MKIRKENRKWLQILLWRMLVGFCVFSEVYNVLSVHFGRDCFYLQCKGCALPAGLRTPGPNPANPLMWLKPLAGTIPPFPSCK